MTPQDAKVALTGGLGVAVFLAIYLIGRWQANPYCTYCKRRHPRGQAR